jgi:hypothetical protein
MNPTSQNPGRKFPFGSGHQVMGNSTLYKTLIFSTVLVLLALLLEYYLVHGRNPFNRVGYALFMSVVPALAALVVLKLTTFFVSWRGAAGVYIAFLVLVSMIQSFGR